MEKIRSYLCSNKSNDDIGGREQTGPTSVFSRSCDICFLAKHEESKTPTKNQRPWKVLSTSSQTSTFQNYLIWDLSKLQGEHPCCPFTFTFKISHLRPLQVAGEHPPCPSSELLWRIKFLGWLLWSKSKIRFIWVLRPDLLRTGFAEEPFWNSQWEKIDTRELSAKFLNISTLPPTVFWFFRK